MCSPCLEQMTLEESGLHQALPKPAYAGVSLRAGKFTGYINNLCPPVKTDYPPVQNVNETPAYERVLFSYYWIYSHRSHRVNSSKPF